MKKKQTSCGMIITNGKYVLGCLPTHSYFYEPNCLDLPKGRKEDNETESEAVIREVKEETGLDVSKKKFTYTGTFDYRPKKDLALFVLCVPKLPEKNTLHCDSKFTDYRGEVVSEHCGYEYVPIEDINNRFLPSLGPIISKFFVEVQHGPIR